MPKLLRVRLLSIGHPSARFPDLTLDFRDENGHATDSTLWLRNGGGKSSLLNLFFALVRPDRREFLGNRAEAKQRRLEDYVGPKDRAVVCAEWELDQTNGNGRTSRYLTGVLYEWGGVAGSEAGQLRHLFFGGHVSSPLFSLEDLPLFATTDGDRLVRRALSNFRQELSALREREPHLQIYWTTTNREWTDHLTSIGIDPELFTYQIRMNVREGGADEVFRFADHEQFVDFLLALALDPALGEGVTKNIGTYRQELRDRKDQWLPEIDLVTGLAERLQPLVGIAADRKTLVSQLATCNAQLEAVAAHVATRSVEVTREHQAAEQAARDARERVDELRASQLVEHRTAAALRVHAAEARHQLAVDNAQRARTQHENAVNTVRLWEGAVPLAAARKHQANAEAYDVELQRKRADHAPDLEALRAAATAFAGALSGEAAARRTSSSKESLRAAAERDAARDLRDEAAASQATASREREKARQLGERIDEIVAERTRLCAANIVREDEVSAVALERHTEAARVLTQDIDDLRAQDEDLATGIADLQRQRGLAIDAAATAAQEAKFLADAHEKASRARQELETDVHLKRVLESEVIDLLRLPAATIHQVADAARASREQIVTRRVARAQDERSIVHLRAEGLLPPTPDVELVLATLRTRVHAAWSGWTYIAENIARGRWREPIESDPAIVAGVVIRDADFTKAVEILEAAALPLETPVVVAPQSALSTAGARPFRVFGPRGDALFDRAAADAELKVREARVATSDAEVGGLESTANALHRLATRLEEFFARYPSGWFDEQALQISGAEARARSEKGRSETIGQEIEARNGERQRLAADVLRATNERSACTVNAATCRSFAAREEHLERWRREREEARKEAAIKDRSAADALVQAVAAEGRAGEHEETARRLGEEAVDIEGELRQVEYVVEGDGVAAAAARGIDALRGDYRRLRSLYQDKVGEDGLLQLARAEREHAANHRSKYDRLAHQYKLDEREVVSALATLAEGVDVEQRLREANEVKTSAFGVMGNRANAEQSAKTEADNARKRAEDVGADLLLEYAAGPNQAEEEATEAERRAMDCGQRADVAGGDYDRAKTSAAGCAQALGLLAKESKRVGSIQSAYVDLLAAAPPSPRDLTRLGDDDVADRLDEVEQILKTARDRVAALTSARQTAVRTLRSFAAEARFESLRSLLAKKLCEEEPDDLEKFAEQHIADLGARRTQLEAQVVSINRHRETLITEALNAAEEGLALLRTASNQSRLPEHVPGVGGAQFLRITTHAVDDPTERRARIATLIDEVCDAGVLPSGLSLVQRGVRRLAKPIRVHVLHPDPDRGREMVEIPEIARCSGGEQLTSAILLYCTLAQVRARTRGAVRKGTSVLILDNPIGRASRARFVELQREVARAMGVQLLYTTGVNDYDALRALPKIVRLRNQRFDRTTGHQVVEHDERQGGIEAMQIGRRDVSPAPPESS